MGYFKYLAYQDKELGVKMDSGAFSIKSPQTFWSLALTQLPEELNIWPRNAYRMRKPPVEIFKQGKSTKWNGCTRHHAGLLRVGSDRRRRAMTLKKDVTCKGLT